jgi:Mg/Co/Ni transporter MgtE
VGLETLGVKNVFEKRPDVPTCGLKERVGDLRALTAGWDTCVVVSPERVVLGLLRKKELEGDPDATAEQVMRPGPKTFRPNVTLEELLKSMREHDIQTTSLVTTGDGRLLGVISRADAEATLAHEGVQAAS